jgi:hypothetical protein
VVWSPWVHIRATGSTLHEVSGALDNILVGHLQSNTDAVAALLGEGTHQPEAALTF